MWKDTFKKYIKENSLKERAEGTGDLMSNCF